METLDVIRKDFLLVQHCHRHRKMDNSSKVVGINLSQILNKCENTTATAPDKRKAHSTKRNVTKKYIQLPNRLLTVLQVRWLVWKPTLQRQ